MTSSEVYYTQQCATCEERLSLVHYHRAHANRTCQRCFAQWLGKPLPETARIMAMHSLRLWDKLARTYPTDGASKGAPLRCNAPDEHPIWEAFPGLQRKAGTK